MNILLGNHGNKLEIIDKMSTLCSYSFKIKRKIYFSKANKRYIQHEYYIDIYINKPYNIKIARLDIAFFLIKKNSNVINIYQNQFYIIDEKPQIWQKYNRELYTRIYHNEDSISERENSMKKIVLTIDRDLAIMERFGYIKLYRN